MVPLFSCHLLIIVGVLRETKPILYMGEICCYPTSHLPLGVTNEGREAIITSTPSSSARERGVAIRGLLVHGPARVVARARRCAHRIDLREVSTDKQLGIVWLP